MASRAATSASQWKEKDRAIAVPTKIQKSAEPPHTEDSGRRRAQATGNASTTGHHEANGLWICQSWRISPITRKRSEPATATNTVSSNAMGRRNGDTSPTSTQAKTTSHPTIGATTRKKKL